MPVVLVVEDNAILASTLVRFLREQGHLTVAAVVPTAEAALEQLALQTVDLVLVDVSLPAMSGIDLVAILRKQYPELPCLMLSGHKESSYIQRALAAGARGYVIKGDPLAILTAVKRVLLGETYLSDGPHKTIYH
jgi:DNA-binding NarL/FixJ family response regulator